MIELKNVSKSFDTAEGKVDALKDVSITIEDGDIYGIIGMSGAAGKYVSPEPITDGGSWIV